MGRKRLNIDQTLTPFAIPEDTRYSQYAKTPDDWQFLKKMDRSYKENIPKHLAQQEEFAAKQSAFYNAPKDLSPINENLTKPFIDTDPARNIDVSEFRKKLGTTASSTAEVGAEQAAKQSALSRIAGAAGDVGRFAKGVGPALVTDMALSPTETSEHDDRSPEAYQQELNQYRSLTPEQQSKFKSRFAAQ